MKLNIRPCELSDAKAILEIYTPYVENTAISFETKVPSLEKFSQRIKNIKSSYPYLVCEADGKIAGYAYASKFRKREAYRYSIEVSVYVDSKFVGNKIGTLLYESLFKELESYNYHTAYACITYPNDKSIGIHKKFGFSEIGIFHNAGYKLNKWHDVIWLEKQLKNCDTL